MYYNLDAFSDEIRKLRKNLKLTQKDISDISGINVDTLSKMENGKSIPKQETLDILSVVLKKDLNMILLKYRYTDYFSYHRIKDLIEQIIEDGNYLELNNELKNLNENINTSDMNVYFFKLAKQLFLLVNSIYLKVNCKDYNKALSNLIEAMKITSPKFSIEKYNKLVYNDNEIRILMNIALVLNRTESTEKCLNVLLFCLDSIDEDDWELRIKLTFNTSYAYHRLLLDEDALHYANLGIQACIDNRSLYCLPHLYTRKGVAEYLLGHDRYMEALTKAKYLFEISKQEDAKLMTIRAIKENYGIDL